MFPAVPLPQGNPVRIPVEATLKSGWRYDARRRMFVSDKGMTFKPGGELPKRSRIVSKVHGLVGSKARQLSAPQRDLLRYLQVILPPDESAAAYVDTVRAWPCIADAQVGPDVSLPHPHSQIE